MADPVDLNKAQRVAGNIYAERSNTGTMDGFNVRSVDILDENTLLAGGASGGMFRSTNAGQSWVMTTHPNQLHNVTCVSQDTRVGKENVWYFGEWEAIILTTSWSYC